MSALARTAGAVALPRQDRAITEALRKVAGEAGVLEPGMVLDAARDPGNPLHGCFEWDDAKAGHAHRLMQAYKLCAAQRKFVVVTRDEGTVHLKSEAQTFALREYLSTKTGESKMVDRAAALADPEIRARQVAAFLGELRSWTRRTIDIDDLAKERAAVLALIGEE